MPLFVVSYGYLQSNRRLLQCVVFSCYQEPSNTIVSGPVRIVNRTCHTSGPGKACLRLTTSIFCWTTQQWLPPVIVQGVPKHNSYPYRMHHQHSDKPSIGPLNTPLHLSYTSQLFFLSSPFLITPTASAYFHLLHVFIPHTVQAIHFQALTAFNSVGLQ